MVALAHLSLHVFVRMTACEGGARCSCAAGTHGLQGLRIFHMHDLDTLQTTSVAHDPLFIDHFLVLEARGTPAQHGTDC